MSQPSRQDYDQRLKWAWDERRERFSLIYKMLDFLGVVLGVICIFVLLALLFSLISWLFDDIPGLFSNLKNDLR